MFLQSYTCTYQLISKDTCSSRIQSDINSIVKWSLNNHIEDISKKGTMFLIMARRIFNSTWGLKPKQVYWLHTTVIRTMISHYSVVWWPKVKQVTAAKKLAKVQRAA